MHRTVIAVWAVFLALVGAAAPGHAEKRVALVVGNDLYNNLPADQQLRRAATDARAVGDALGRLASRCCAARTSAGRRWSRSSMS